MIHHGLLVTTTSPGASDSGGNTSSTLRARIESVLIFEAMEKSDATSRPARS